MQVEDNANALEANVERAGSAGSTNSTSGATDAEVRVWRFTSSGMHAERSLHAEDGHPRSGEVVWVDLSDYRASDLEVVANHLGLDPAGVGAALAPWQRPGVTAFRDHALVNASVLDLDEETLRIHANEMDCFIGETFVITAHSRALSFIDQIIERAEGNAELVREDPAYLLYIVLDELVDTFADTAEQLDRMVEDLEDQALLSDDRGLLNMLVRHKRFVYSVNRLVVQHGFLFHGLLRPDFPFVSGESVESSFTQLNERAHEVAGMFDETRQEMRGTFDIYMSSVAHRTNGIMKTLTMISILVLPATAIFGFFGTNFVQLPFFGTAGFVFMFLLLVFLTAGQLMLFRMRGWLS